eukprot:5369993-Prymnesium_polylepis.1
MMRPSRRRSTLSKESSSPGPVASRPRCNTVGSAPSREAAKQPGQLPAGWQEVNNPPYGTYYYCPAMGKTQWDRPEPASTPGAAPNGAGAAPPMLSASSAPPLLSAAASSGMSPLDQLRQCSNGSSSGRSRAISSPMMCSPPSAVAAVAAAPRTSVSPSLPRHSMGGAGARGPR